MSVATIVSKMYQLNRYGKGWLPLWGSARMRPFIENAFALCENKSDKYFQQKAGKF
jgi:hypothetical protein